MGAVDAAMEAGEQAPPLGIGADEADEARPPAERGDVVRGVAGAPATISVASYFRMSTGASRDTRATSP